jgi:hypothetical protein
MEKEKIADIVILIVIFIFLLSYFKPSLILSDSTTSGGDTGSHFFPAMYMRYYLLPNFKLTGWCPHWFAGMPMFSFYFPLPYAIMSFISLFAGMNIAFRIGTLLGVFLLPIFAYFSFRLMKLRFPAPILGALMTLPFLFLETHSMYGGNILSTLAGEFAHSLSLALAVLFFGLIYRGIEEKKYIIPAAVILSLTMISSIFPGMICVLGSIYFLLSRNWKENALHLFKVFALAFVLIGFWTVPFLLKMQYTTSYDWLQYQKLEDMFPGPLIPYYVIGLLGVIFFRKNNVVRYFMFSIILSFLFYGFLPQGHLWNTRFLPVVYLFTLFIVAVSVALFLTKIRLQVLVPFIILVIVLPIINSSTQKVEPWVQWNYQGYEGKYDSTFLRLADYLKQLPMGRILYEYSDSHNSFGSPRAFESIPAYTGKPTITGLFIDSAVTAPFHFIMQPELSDKPSCPLMGQNCPSVNLDRGLEHMKMFNIRYFIATTTRIKNLARAHAGYEYLDSVGALDIFLINSTGYVEALKYEPLFASRKDWKKVSLTWFEKGDLDVHLVFDKYRPGQVEKIPVDISDCKITNEKISNEELEFDTNCIGKPHLVKISYFPNWKVEGADKIYLASPSFMLVYPTSEHVRLYYGIPWMDFLGYMATIAGLIIVGLAVFKFKLFKKIEKFVLNFKFPILNKKYLIGFVIIIFIAAIGFKLYSMRAVEPEFSNWQYSQDGVSWEDIDVPFSRFTNGTSGIIQADLHVEKWPLKKIWIMADDCIEKIEINNETVFQAPYCGPCAHCEGIVFDINKLVEFRSNKVSFYIYDQAIDTRFEIKTKTANGWHIVLSMFIILFIFFFVLLTYFPKTLSEIRKSFEHLSDNKYCKKIYRKLGFKTLLWLSVFLFFVLFASFQLHGPNAGSRFAQTKPLALYRTFEINREDIDFYSGIDYSIVNGKYYGDKPPGLSVALVPFYNIGNFLHKLNFPLPAIGRYNYPGDAYAHFLMMLAVIAFCAYGIVKLYDLSLIFFNRKISFFLAIIFMLSLYWVYAATLFSHSVTAALLVIAAYYLFKKKSLLSGLFLGLAFTVDYVVIFLVPIFLLYNVIKYKSVKELSLNLAFLAIIGILMMMYNYFVFGGIFTSSYSFTLMRGAQDFNQELFGGLHLLLFSTWRGLFFYNLILISGIPGIWIMYRKYKWESILSILSVIIPLVFFAKYSMSYGGMCFGPRQLLIVVPFLILFSGFFFNKMKLNRIFVPVIISLLIISVFHSFLGAFVTPIPYPEVNRNPIYEINFPLLLQGRTNSLIYGNYPVVWWILLIISVFILIAIYSSQNEN